MQWLIAAVTNILQNFTPLTHERSVFNVGQYRRELVGVNMSYDYYDPFNTTGAQSRRYVLFRILIYICHIRVSIFVSWSHGHDEI